MEASKPLGQEMLMVVSVSRFRQENKPRRETMRICSVI